MALSLSPLLSFRLVLAGANRRDRHVLLKFGYQHGRRHVVCIAPLQYGPHLAGDHNDTRQYPRHVSPVPVTATRVSCAYQPAATMHVDEMQAGAIAYSMDNPPIHTFHVAARGSRKHPSFQAHRYAGSIFAWRGDDLWIIAFWDAGGWTI